MYYRLKHMKGPITAGIGIYWPCVRFISVFDGPETSIAPDSPFAQRKYPTVSTIINKTMPLENAMILRKWQEKMRRQMGDRAFNEHMACRLILLSCFLFDSLINLL